MEKSKIRIYVVVFKILLLLTIAAYIIKTMINCISLYNCTYCSAPWYTAVILNSLLFAIPLLIETFVLVYFHKRLKKI